MEENKVALTNSRREESQPPPQQMDSDDSNEKPITPPCPRINSDNESPVRPLHESFEVPTSQKRSHEEQDPDYIDVADQQTKRQKALEFSAKQNVSKRIAAIVRNEFQREINSKETELQKIDRKLTEARAMMDRLRACIVATYYGQANTGTMRSPQLPTLNAPPPSVHPALKKLIGKTPKHRAHSTTERAVSEGLATSEINVSNRSTDSSRPSTHSEQLSSSSSSLSTDTLSAPASEKKERTSSAHPRLQPQPMPSTDLPEGHSRFKIRKKIIVGNVSKYIPIDQREASDMSSHKWMVYVRGPKADPDISGFVHKVWFFLHHSYKPNDLIEVCSPPFHLTRRGWGEFPVRVQLHFVDPRNKKVDVIHHLKLDKTFTGLQSLGGETVVEIELERAPGLQSSNVDSSISATSSPVPPTSISSSARTKITAASSSSPVILEDESTTSKFSSSIQPMSASPAVHNKRHISSVAIREEEDIKRRKLESAQRHGGMGEKQTISTNDSEKQKGNRASVSNDSNSSSERNDTGENACHHVGESLIDRDARGDSAKQPVVVNGISRNTSVKGDDFHVTIAHDSKLKEEPAVNEGSVEDDVVIDVGDGIAEGDLKTVVLSTRHAASVVSVSSCMRTPLSQNSVKVVSSHISNALSDEKSPLAFLSNSSSLSSSSLSLSSSSSPLTQQVSHVLNQKPLVVVQNPHLPSQTTPSLNPTHVQTHRSSPIPTTATSKPAPPLANNTQSAAILRVKAPSLVSIKNPKPVFLVKHLSKSSTNSHVRVSSGLTSNSATTLNSSLSTIAPSVLATPSGSAVPDSVSQDSKIAIKSCQNPKATASKQVSLLTGQIVQLPKPVSATKSLSVGATPRPNALNSNSVRIVIPKKPTQGGELIHSRNIRLAASPVSSAKASPSSHAVYAVPRIQGSKDDNTFTIVNPKTVSLLQNSKSVSLLHNSNVFRVNQAPISANSSTTAAPVSQTNHNSPQVISFPPKVQTSLLSQKTLSSAQPSALSSLVLPSSSSSDPSFSKMSALGITKHGKGYRTNPDLLAGVNFSSSSSPEVNGRKARPVTSSGDAPFTGFMPPKTKNPTEAERIQSQYEVLMAWKANKHLFDKKSKRIIIGSAKDSLEDESPSVDPLETGEYPNLRYLVKAAVVLHPLVQAGVNKTIHPYCADSLEQWFSWPLGKQRASEWHRACFVTRYLRFCLGGENVFQGESLWKTRQLVIWCRRHGFSPVLTVNKAARIKQEPPDGEHHFSHQHKDVVTPTQHFRSYTDVKGLVTQGLLKQEVAHEADVDSELDIVLTEGDEQTGKLPKDREVTLKNDKRMEDEKGSDPSSFMTLSNGGLFVCDLLRKRGLKLQPTEILTGVNSLSAADMLYAAMLSFGSDVLTESLAVHALQKSQGNDVKESEMTRCDVNAALLRLPEASFCCNTFLGKEEEMEERKQGVR